MDSPPQKYLEQQPGSFKISFLKKISTGFLYEIDVMEVHIPPRIFKDPLH